jgi:hypothetical protein
MSKFTGIEYPFFGLLRLPYDIKYKGSQILVTVQEGLRQLILDDTSLPGLTFYQRLWNLEKKYGNKRLRFTHTATNLASIITSKIKWGIDSNAKIFNLSNVETYKGKYLKINKIKGNLIWVNSISYPLELPKHMAELPYAETYYAGVIYIDLTWHLWDITPMPQQLEKTVWV